jgi:leucyl aminopeptidase (aminopeptidase T)
VEVSRAFRGSLSLLRTCARAKRGDSILIVTDSETDPAIAGTIMTAVTSLGMEASTVTMKVRALPGDEPPEPVSAAMLASDVVICPTSRTMYHTDARTAACRKGARFISMAGATMAVLGSEAMFANFEKQERVLRKVVSRMKLAKNIRVSNPGGTKLEFSVQGRVAGGVPGFCKRPGDATGVPDIEAYVAPVEKSVNGVLVVDASTSVTGIVHEPITVEIQHGIALKIHGGSKGVKLKKILKQAGKRAAFQVGEFGIGLNPKASIRGSIIEDEGVFGTAHIALGDNTRLGGKNRAPIHVDLVFKRAEVELDGRTLLKEKHLTL